MFTRLFSLFKKKVNHMTINEAGLNLIKSSEGCKLTVYKDIAGLNTVGYGHRTDVAPGITISEDTANELLRQDIDKFERGVDECVQVPLGNNRFSALVCFSYNLGLGALRSSHLLHEVNAGNFEAAAEQFLLWDHISGRVIPGLTRRRVAERALFLKEDT